MHNGSHMAKAETCFLRLHWKEALTNLFLQSMSLNESKQTGQDACLLQGWPVGCPEIYMLRLFG